MWKGSAATQHARPLLEVRGGDILLSAVLILDPPSSRACPSISIHPNLGGGNKRITKRKRDLNLFKSGEKYGRMDPRFQSAASGMIAPLMAYVGVPYTPAPSKRATRYPKCRGPKPAWFWEIHLQTRISGVSSGSGRWGATRPRARKKAAGWFPACCLAANPPPPLLSGGMPSASRNPNRIDKIELSVLHHQHYAINEAMEHFKFFPNFFPLMFEHRHSLWVFEASLR